MKDTQITKQELIEKMKSCEQTKGQSVLQHGESVRDHLFDIINHLRNNDPLKYKWKLPDWLYDNKNKIISSLPDDETLILYTTFHDCGKPFCIHIDEMGIKHFPDHAKMSYQIFNKVFDNEVAAHLILHDMDIHTLKSKDVEEFSKLPYYLTLLLTGLAEIHSNCKMFGGFESTSFKIKFKSINQRGKQLFKLIKNNKSL